MSDPFDVLRSAESSAMPDVAAIKGRAKRIQQRQKMVVGAGAASVAAIAVVAVLLSTGPTQRTAELAQREDRRSTADDDRASDAQGAGSIGSPPEGYEDTTADEVPAPKAVEESGSTSAAVGAGAPNEVLVATVKADRQPLGGAEFALEVCNTSGTKQVRSFATAQRYDFIVKRGDNVVWTWSDDRVFAQSTGEETWEPDDCRGWMETWDGMTSSGTRAADGEYTVEAVLTTKPEVRTKPVTFCHGLC